MILLRKTPILLATALCCLAFGLLAVPAMAQNGPLTIDRLQHLGFGLLPGRDVANNPERTARVFTRDVFLEALRHGDKKVVLDWLRNGPGFTFNTQQTAKAAGYDSDAPAYADILGEPAKNFLECTGGPFALCFYSGPEGPLPCDTRKNDPVSECTCTVIEFGPYFVDILGILNEDVYEATVDQCGADGSLCDADAAPVCDVVNEKLDEQKKMFPGADIISVFSLDFATEVPIGQSQCDGGTYAACMTAPCYYPKGDSTSDTAQCLCPNYTGPFQIGQSGKEDMCSLGKRNVWSAANNVNGGKTFPPHDIP